MMEELISGQVSPIRPLTSWEVSICYTHLLLLPLYLLHRLTNACLRHTVSEELNGVKWQICTHTEDQWERQAHPGRQCCFPENHILNPFYSSANPSDLWALRSRSLWLCTWRRKPLLFTISLSSVSGFLLYCPATSELLRGSDHSWLLICGRVGMSAVLNE